VLRVARAIDVVPSSLLTPGPAWRRLCQHLFEIAVAVCFAILGVTYLLHPNTGIASPVGRVVHPFDYAWSLGYIAALPLIFGGIARRSTRMRVAGLVILASALIMQGIVAMFFGGHIELRDLIYWIYAAVCLIRAYVAATAIRRVLDGS
jgi:hypothetical protein